MVLIFLIYLPFFLGMFHILVSFVCYHFGSFGSVGYRFAKVEKFLEKGNLITHLTLADISFNSNYFGHKSCFQMLTTIVFQF